MMVNLMTIVTASSSVDWSNFSASVVIEVTRPNGVFTCSGVAINEDTIITAAHCLDGEILKVRVSNEASYSAQGTFLEIEGFNLHPEYNPENSNYRADLAKIKLKNKLPGNVNFFPIIKRDHDLQGQFFRLGFGSRNNINARTLISPVLKNVRRPENILELNDMYSYSGDSGGPVLMQKNGQIFLVAIHSTLSFGPEGKYSFNPLLSSHRSWLEN
jgi:V8-like Glu-specific endopeptidase